MIGKMLGFFNLHRWRYDIEYKTVENSPTTLLITRRKCKWCDVVQVGHDFKWENVSNGTIH